MISFFPQELLDFLYVAVLSFLVGLELKTYRYKREKQKLHIGSTRTFTFIGILGYLLFKIEPLFFIVGYGALFGLYAIYYIHKLKAQRASILSFLLISLVYLFGPLMEIFSLWMPTLLFVLIVFILGSNRVLSYILAQLNIEEFETLGKFLLLSAVILPLLPHKKIAYIDISPFEIWLVVVVVSSISYGSYIAQKYIFKKRSYLLTALFGGLYSSTATTVVLAKKAATTPSTIIDSAIVLATSMMYIRLLALAAIFNLKVAYALAPFMVGFAALGIALALLFYKRGSFTPPIDDRNPLELKAAFLFAFLFLVMMVLTRFISSSYGDEGMQLLSFIVGFSDIDPFVLSLLTTKHPLSLVLSAILIASGSNNLLKAFYSLLFSQREAKKAALSLFFLGILTIIAGILTKGW